MSLSNETSLSDHDVFEINRLVQEVLAPIQEFIRQATAAVIPPDTFLLVPTHVERLSNLISSFNSLSNLLPTAYFEYAKWEMLECHDKLLEIEGFGSASGQLPSLFGDLDWEIGPRGYPRLALPRSIIETLIAEGDFSNVEIASLLGESMFQSHLLHNCVLTMHCKTPIRLQSSNTQASASRMGHSETSTERIR